MLTGQTALAPQRTRMLHAADSWATSGASLIIALLFLLVCAVVGAAVLTAATVTTGQLVDFEDSEQAYYSTSSAAALFRDEIVDGTCVPAAGSASASCTLVQGNAELEKLLASAVAETATYGSASCDLNVSDSDEGTVDVTAHFSMGSDYSIVITCWPTSYNGTIGSYKVVCTIPSSLLYASDGTTVQSIAWKEAVITKADSSSYTQGA